MRSRLSWWTMGRRTVLRTLREHVAAASFTQRSAPSQLRGMVTRGLQMVRSSLLSTPIRRSTRGRSTQSNRPWRRAASSLERPASATAECPRVSHSQRSSRSLFSSSQDSMLASCFVGAPIGKPSGVITKSCYGPRTQSFSSHLSDSVAPAGYITAGGPAARNRKRFTAAAADYDLARSPRSYGRARRAPQG
jgi:hypothetical protein